MAKTPAKPAPKKAVLKKPAAKATAKKPTKPAAPAAPVAVSAAPVATPPAAPPTSGMPWDQFALRVRDVTDSGKLAKGLTMLKKEKFQLYAEVNADHISGVVRSQSSATRVYACRLAKDGKYSCCTQNLIQCVVSRGSPCKHLLVLVVGLVKAGQFDGTTALDWLKLSRKAGLKKEGFTPDKGRRYRNLSQVP